jgi:hypothetical protein
MTTPSIVLHPSIHDAPVGGGSVDDVKRITSAKEIVRELADEVKDLMRR